MGENGGKSEINILEIGFGRGLNALRTALETQKNNLKVHFTSLEPSLISSEDAELLNYEKELNTDLLAQIHNATYYSKTIIRKELQSVDFKVEKHVRMWGKREVVRAVLEVSGFDF